MMSKSIQFKSILEEMPHSNVYNRHLKLPTDVYEQWRKENKEKRILWSVNNGDKHSSALMPYGNGIYYIILNKELCKKQQIEIGDDLLVRISKEESKYGISLPEEMEILLEQDKEGSQYFHSLTPGKIRSLLHLIGKPKSSNIRLRKAITTLNYLKKVHGKLDFKELNQAYKDSNKF